MTITSEDIQKLASLARIKVANEEAEQYATEISHILKYVDQIQEVTEGADTTSASIKNPSDLSHRNVMRDDVADQLLNPVPQKLVEAAPKHQDGLVEVKKILG
ncbi:MAG: Asp-tRNA(Asn)/Glu-tRNA(Gln) amidotransferase subunit GatC [bacterium]